MIPTYVVVTHRYLKSIGMTCALMLVGGFTVRGVAIGNTVSEFEDISELREHLYECLGDSRRGLK